MNALHASSSIAEDSSIDSLIYDVSCERDLFYGGLAWSESLGRSEAIRGGGRMFENGCGGIVVRTRVSALVNGQFT